MITYLHRPFEILSFLVTGNFKKFQHNFKTFLCFQRYTTCKLSRACSRGFSYMIFLFALLIHDRNETPKCREITKIRLPTYLSEGKRKKMRASRNRFLELLIWVKVLMNQVKLVEDSL